MFSTATGFSNFQLFLITAVCLAVYQACSIWWHTKQKDEEKKLEMRTIALREKELEIRERELILREAEADRRRNLHIAK